MRENKAEITKALEEVLKLTMAGVEALEYVDIGNEYVEIYYTGGGYQSVNVTADSGCALIRDVMRAID